MGPGYVTNHALDRFGEHRSAVSVGHFIGSFEDAIPVEKEDVYWILLRPWDDRQGNMYRLSRDGRGVFVLYQDPDKVDTSSGPVFTTYIRLTPIAQDRAAEKFGEQFHYDPIPGTTYRGKHDRLVRVVAVKPDGRIVFEDDTGRKSLSATAFAERFSRYSREVACSSN